VSTSVPLLDKDQIARLTARAREVVEYRKSGLSLNHIQGCPLDCSYCIRHTYGLWDQRRPHALMTDAEAVEQLASHRYFQPHTTPIQILNRATDTPDVPYPTTTAAPPRRESARWDLDLNPPAKPGRRDLARHRRPGTGPAATCAVRAKCEDLTLGDAEVDAVEDALSLYPVDVHDGRHRYVHHGRRPVA
jgi:hypothetical protein